jgi:DNA polymerase zeta
MEPATALEAEKGIIEDEWGRTHASGIHIVGRVVLNLWRLMRGEVKLNIYSLEAVADAVLRRKVCMLSTFTFLY